MRTPGKSMEEFYNRIAEEGVHFIRGKVADVYPDPNDGDDRPAGRPGRGHPGGLHPARSRWTWWCWPSGLEPQPTPQDVRRMFNMSCGSEGFFLERHPKLAPVNTFTDGIFLAGCCQGPQGHSRHRGPGRRGRGRGHGAH